MASSLQEDMVDLGLLRNIARCMTYPPDLLIFGFGDKDM